MSSSTTSKCPFACHQGALWFGLLVSTMLTYKHVEYYRKKSKKGPPIRAPGNKAWRMSKWIKHGGIIRTQGLCGDFTKIPGSSVAQQTSEALDRLDEILKLAGVQRKNLLAITIYLSDLKDFEEMNSVYDKWVDPKGLPTRLCVQAKIGHQALVEIRAEAYYDEDED